VALTVVFDGTNITQAEAADSASWAEQGGGTGSAQDDDSQLQGSECRGRKVSGATLGFAFQRATLDLSGSGEHVGIWLYVGTRGAIDTKANGGMRVRLGGGSDPDTSPWNEWYVHGSDTIPKTNKWMRVWLDVDRGSPDNSAGTFNANDVESFGGSFTGAAITGNFRNYFIDRIDRMSGSGGLTGTGTGGTFADFLTADVDTSGNVYGVVERIPGGMQINARVTIGTSSSAVLNDSGLTIIFQDEQFCESDFMGLTFDLQNASTDVDLADIKIASAGSTNLGDFIVSGTTGAFDAARVTIDNLRIVTFTSACSFLDGAISNSGQITHGGADLSGTKVSGYEGTVDTGALTYNQTADPDGEMDNMSFTKGTAATHAIEFGTSAPETMTLRGIDFSGYNASDAATDSTLYVGRTTGTTTINLIGCTGNISYKSAGATVLLVPAPVTTTITVRDIGDDSVIQNAVVLLVAANGTGDWDYQASVTQITRSGAVATVTQTAHAHTTGDYVLIKGATEEEYNGCWPVTVTGANTYTYSVPGTPTSPAGGTIVATGGMFNSLTNASGVVTDTRSFSVDQPFTGVVRRSSASPYYISAPIADTIDKDSGFALTVRLLPDE